jgi:hypothetical protein
MTPGQRQLLKAVGTLEWAQRMFDESVVPWSVNCEKLLAEIADALVVRQHEAHLRVHRACPTPIEWARRRNGLVCVQCGLLRQGDVGYERHGLRVGERVVCVDVPRLHGTVVRCAEDGVDVRWDDGSFGEAVWDQTVAHNAYRFPVVRAPIR